MPTIYNRNNLETIAPGYAERAAFVGKTGSGKSFLAKRLLCETDHTSVFIIDPKDEIFVKDSLRVSNPSKLPGTYEGVLIYAPEPKYDNLDSYDTALRYVYERGHTLLFIDELYALGFNGIYPETLRALYTRGRSRGISVFGCSQRPAWVPLFCISECEHVYCFELRLADDRRRIAGLIGDKGLVKMSGHDFLYHSNDLEEPVTAVYEE